METLSDKEAIKLVKEIIAFMDTGIETGEDVEGFNGENFAYFKNKEDESILERYQNILIVFNGHMNRKEHIRTFQKEERKI